jgi:hypothetical protein
MRVGTPRAIESQRDVSEVIAGTEGRDDYPLQKRRLWVCLGEVNRWEFTKSYFRISKKQKTRKKRFLIT